MLLSTGGVLSVTCIVCVQLVVCVLSVASVAVHNLSITISPLHGPDEVILSWNVTMGLPQDTSVGVAVADPVPDGELSPVIGQVIADGGQAILGAVQQLPTTDTVKEH